MLEELKEQIIENIEMFVNCIYDNKENEWCEATLEDWIKAVYEETINWFSKNGASYKSPVNRFSGKERLRKEIEKQLIIRLKELKEEGYNIKAI